MGIQAFVPSGGGGTPGFDYIASIRMETYNRSWTQSGAAGTILYDPANLYITLGADCEVALNGGLMGYHKGRIGLFRLYNKALSTQEVLNNYDDSKSRFGY